MTNKPKTAPGIQERARRAVAFMQEVGKDDDPQVLQMDIDEAVEVVKRA